MFSQVYISVPWLQICLSFDQQGYKALLCSLEAEGEIFPTRKALQFFNAFESHFQYMLCSTPPIYRNEQK